MASRSINTPRSSRSVSAMARLPVVEHPMSRRGDTDLEIRGASAQGDSTSRKRNLKSDVQFHKGEQMWMNGYDEPNQMILSWPPEFMQDPRKKTNKKLEQSKNRISRSASFTAVELEVLIKEKLTTGFYGLRQMFRANDPNGQGQVTREALLHILYALVGYFTTDQYLKFLRRHGLDSRPTISFDSFVSCFQDNETVQKEWMNPVHQVACSRHPEDHLRETEVWARDTTYKSGTYCYSLLKEKCKERTFDAHNYFPSACFEKEGLIVPPQLREALARLGMRLTNEEFHKLWDRFDRDGLGAVKTKQLFRIVGLCEDGRPKHRSPKRAGPAGDFTNRRHQTEITRKSSHQKDELTITKKTTTTLTMTVKETTKTKKDTQAAEEDAVNDAKLKKIKQNKNFKIQPHMEKVMDCLYFCFEEPYNAMLAGFQLFDSMGDGYISKVDFRRVLREFGFDLAAMELDGFLVRCNMRLLLGQINYRDFLKRFQWKSEGSVTNRVLTSRNHKFQSDKQPGRRTSLSAEELEASLVEYFHEDFLRLMGAFKACDRYELGVITQHEFRHAIEKRLGYQLSDKQFKELVAEVGLDADGLLPHYKFLKMFDMAPGEGNRKLEWGVYGKQLKDSDSPEVNRLRVRAKTAMELKTHQEQISALEELTGRVQHLLQSRFHTFDKLFKQMDKKMVGRISKWQFGALLKKCGLELSANELDKIWASMDPEADGILGYVKLLGRFISHSQRPMTRQHMTAQEIKESKRQIEEAKKVQKERLLEKYQTQEKAEKRVSKDKKYFLQIEESENVEPVKENSIEISDRQLHSALNRISADVVQNWDILKARFRQLDPHGYANIAISEMKVILNAFPFNLDEEERRAILQKFDHSSNGRFSYMNFLKLYTQQKLIDDKQQACPVHHVAQRPHSAPAGGRVPLPVDQSLQHIREQVLSGWHNTRQAFKALDLNRDGFLDKQEFKKALRVFGIQCTDENVYHLLSEFDTNMDGKISFQEFLDQCINI